VQLKPTQTFELLQNWFGPQGEQIATPPQPSLTEPHCAPCWAQVFCAQLALPQTLAAPTPPQVWPGAQSPQWMLPPQPSG
jgi:hypothetical protein